MTRHEAIVKLAATLEIERTEAADLIDEYALNSGEVQDVEEILVVTEERVQQIIDDQQASQYEAEQVQHPALISCQCGEATGDPCAWRGTEADTVTVEYMPEYLRASHVAARNRGSYPANGSIRFRAEQSCAAMLVESEGGWAAIVESNKVLRGGTYAVALNGELLDFKVEAAVRGSEASSYPKERDKHPTCEKFVGADQCGKKASVKVWPGTSDGFWFACWAHGKHLDQHQGPNGTITRVEHL